MLTAQVDTTNLILGDWFQNGGEIQNLEINEEVTFTRTQTENLFLKWTFGDDNSFFRSGLFESPKYISNDTIIEIEPMAFKYNKPESWSFLSNKAELSIKGKGYEKKYNLIAINNDILIVSRSE